MRPKRTEPEKVKHKTQKMLEGILDIRNIRNAAKQMMRSGRAGGVDGMQTDELKGYLKDHWQDLRR